MVIIKEVKNEYTSLKIMKERKEAEPTTFNFRYNKQTLQPNNSFRNSTECCNPIPHGSNQFKHNK